MIGKRLTIKPAGPVQAVLALILLTGLSGTAKSQTVERLIMPGPVIEGHAKFEDDCSRCHSVFDGIEQPDLCLDCHKDVAGDIGQQRGYHGRIAGIDRRNCVGCHTEHEGRDADIVLLNENAFDHARTDFFLRGLHEEASCRSCHVSTKKNREAPSACIDCHKQDDPHDGTLGDTCASCHTESGWHQALVDFNHGKETGFELEGGHRAQVCSACHLDESYQNTPKTCNGCHEIDDVHRARLGADCASCHTTTEWTTVRFDHAVDTNFPLTGNHRSITCESCHIEPPKARQLGMTCISCHQADDEHNGKNGTDCKACHTTDSWRAASFDHSGETGFPLIGGHAPVTCETCHPGPKSEQKDASCHDCHREDDPHEGALGKNCSSCHTDTSWFADLRFDHDLTLFPLIGQHAIVACADCHQTSAFKGEDARCTACHAAEDVHKDNLGSDCAACHNPNDWALWQFDHDRQTRFKLLGSHNGLQCAACHIAPLDDRGARPSMMCGDCHGRDDIHLGAFGDDCGACHSNDSFRGARIRR